MMVTPKIEGVKRVPVMSNAECWTNGVSEYENWPLWRPNINKEPSVVIYAACHD
jgi:hypothetical protein